MGTSASPLRSGAHSGGAAPKDGASVWFLSPATLPRVFELMDRYADRPMDFADGSLVAAAEVLRTTRVLTLHRRDFAAYRIRHGRTEKAFRVIDPA